MSKQKTGVHHLPALYPGLATVLAQTTITKQVMLADIHGKKRLFSVSMLKAFKHFSQLAS